jgi:hypothetical protein
MHETAPRMREFVHNAYHDVRICKPTGHLKDRRWQAGAAMNYAQLSYFFEFDTLCLLDTLKLETLKPTTPSCFYFGCNPSVTHAIENHAELIFEVSTCHRHIHLITKPGHKNIKTLLSCIWVLLSIFVSYI